MRVVFMGTPSFSVPPLRALAAAHDVCLAVTRPDAVRARGKRLEPSAVKAAAVDLGIPVLEARRMDSDVIEALRATEADIFCVVAFGSILPDEVLRMSPLGCVNVHASLLPRWRGAAPIQRCILAGDSCTGASIMRISSGVDTGDVCAQASCAVSSKGADELSSDLSELGASLLVRTLPALRSGDVVWSPQDETRATLAPKIEKGELWLDPKSSAEMNARRVRASSDAAPARCVIVDRPVRVTRAVAVRSAHVAAGCLAVGKERVLLGCADGSLQVLSLKPDGRREMGADAWASGVRVRTGTWQRLA
ncbi:methionyl-tRNA formyltransferase [Coriobacterium glomerans PW2]|uniref:Methionyl-tRNA formyltransferase n=1 Tax=Coriobacterium glomerans (strain ATCC 49209 / DSM 20642 / JCM 10262 / PW2) TaxID=700015 RepID=F2N9T2_CORGP|nr:methionyl-tRNA formyltransferase [Coriobacterium glomerans]AEB07185.1 methionyl-tRNA formyltransferase [Coriobacterium glomerans PW2]